MPRLLLHLLLAGACAVAPALAAAPTVATVAPAPAPAPASLATRPTGSPNPVPPATASSPVTRPLDGTELLLHLTRALQERCVRDRGELELRLNRPWVTVPVPDVPLTVRLLDVPASGLSPLVLIRFELLAGTEPVGTWQAVLQARVWREVWVARGGLRRGQSVSESDLALERRDVLTLREALADPSSTSLALQAAEAVPAGAPLFQRHLRLQPVVHRGQTVTVVLDDGLLNLVMKAEVLEEGAPGQIVRLRNLSSRRELRGKVQNEKTVVPLL